MPISLRVPSLPKAVRDSYLASLRLPDEALTRIGEWVNQHASELAMGDLDEAEMESTATHLQVSRSDFMSAATLAMTLLNAPKPETRAEFLKSTGLIECEPKISTLLSPIQISPEVLVYTRQRGVAIRSAIPTLDDVDAVCDLRAIFGALPSGSRSQSHASDVDKLLGFEPVAIISLELNDASGEDSSYVFQVSESGLGNLIKTLQETLSQLVTVKSLAPASHKDTQ